MRIQLKIICNLVAGVSMGMPGLAFADENGAMTHQTYACKDNTVSSIVEVCKAVRDVLPFVQCPETTATCVKAQQEIFTGLTGETASPANMKPWNGQGVSGQVMQTVGLCLLRDLNAAPMKTHAEASLPIGKISTDGLVDYMEFDAAKGYFKGVHRITAHAPVIGDVDLMTQEFSAQRVDSDLKAKGLKVGEYAVWGGHALEFEADGGNESFSFELDAIKVVTPYGTVTPKPHLTLARASFWSLSPYGGATGLTVNPGGYELSDVYGRVKGASVASGVKITDFKQGKYPGAKRCQPFAADYGCLWPTPSGWDSQVMLGARNVDPGSAGTAWTAPAGVAFPLRPDGNFAKPRGAAEKLPNGYASAGIKIEYEPLGLIPDALLNNGLIKPTLKVFVDPNIAVGYASQFDFMNAQASTWNPTLDPGPPAIPGTPADVDSIHTMALFAGASVAGRFALDAGVDITLHFHLSLPWPLDDLDFNIVDVHPRSAFLEQIDAATKPNDRTALAVSDSQYFRSTGKVFRAYAPLTGETVVGLAHIQKCLAEPAPPAKEPDTPKYTPGDPEDLVNEIDMPCNICTGYADFSYLSTKTVNPLTFELKTVKGYAAKIPPVDDSGLPASEKWSCGGPVPEQPTMFGVPGLPDPSTIKTKAEADAYNKAAMAKAQNNMKNIGCYDQCRVNKQTGAFELVTSAKLLYAAGGITDAPNGCY